MGSMSTHRMLKVTEEADGIQKFLQRILDNQIQLEPSINKGKIGFGNWSVRFIGSFKESNFTGYLLEVKNISKEVAKLDPKPFNGLVYNYKYFFTPKTILKPKEHIQIIMIGEV